VGYRVIRPGDVEWETRPSEPGEAERHRAALSELGGFGLLLYAYGAPPQHGGAEFLDSAV
jgi:hypothetical protein